MSTPSAKCMQSCRHPLPLHVTWSLHPSSVDAPVDVHGRSCNFPLIQPREVFVARHWMGTRPLATQGVFLLSLPLGVGLTGVGLVHWSCAWWTPTHKRMPVSDAMRRRRSQFWWRMHDCLHWSVTSEEGISVMIRCTTSHASSSHLSLIFLFPLRASAFTKTRRAFKSVFFWAFSQSNTALSIGSSLWALALSITCICTSMWPAATHTSWSKWWSLSTLVGLCPGLISPCLDPVEK